jgi:hypothetical protein
LLRSFVLLLRSFVFLLRRAPTTKKEDVLARACFMSCMLLCAILCAGAACADEPSLADKETARSLFEEGDRRYRKGDFKGALEAFEGADELMRVPTTGLERGRTLAQLGRLLEAREVLLRVTRHPEKPGETPVFAKARTEAAELGRAIADRIPSLRIQVTGLAEGTGFVLKVDGADVPEKVVRFPRKVDPGEHTVEVNAEGYHQELRTVTVRESDTADVNIAMRALAPGEAPEPEEPGPLGIPIMSWVGFGVGAVGLIIGAAAGGVTLANVSDLDERCPDGRDRCPPEVQDDLDDAETISHVSTAGFVIGGLGVAVGVAGLFIFGPIQVGDSGTVRPWIGLTSVGMRAQY